jgi:hypothetical protein
MSPPVTAGATREARKPRKIDIVIKPSKRFFLVPPGLGWKHTLCLAWSLHRQEWHPRPWDEVVGCFPPSA